MCLPTAIATGSRLGRDRQLGHVALVARVVQGAANAHRRPSAVLCSPIGAAHRCRVLSETGNAQETDGRPTARALRRVAALDLRRPEADEGKRSELLSSEELIALKREGEQSPRDGDSSLFG